MKREFLLLDLDDTEQWMSVEAKNFPSCREVLDEIQWATEQHNFDERRELSADLRTGNISQRLTDAVKNLGAGDIKIQMIDRQIQVMRVQVDESCSQSITMRFGKNQEATAVA